MKSLKKQYLLIILILLVLNSCKSYYVVGPKEQISTNPISQPNSNLSIPIDISNAKVVQLIKSNVPDPIVEETKTFQIPYYTNVVQPVANAIEEAYTYPCDKVVDITRHIPVIGNVISHVIQHTICEGTHLVTKWTNQVLLKLTPPIPMSVYYKLRLNDAHIDGNGNQFDIHVIIDFAVKADVPATHIGLASCGVGEPMSQVELILTSKLNFDNNGKIIISDKTWGIHWIKACDLTALNISLESILNLPIVKQLVENKIDDLVQNRIPNDFDIKGKLQSNWSKISKPIVIPNTGYFEINTSQINTENLFVDNDSIHTEIGLSCKPIFNMSDNVPNPQPQPFPVISNQQLPDGFNINVLGSIKFSKLNTYASSVFSKYKQQINGKLIKINDVKLYQSDNKLVIGVSLSKPFRGEVYLWGIPKFNVADNTISIDDLEYTIESKNMLAKVANWVLQTGIIENTIKEKFKYNYENNVSQVLAKFQNLNQPLGAGVTLKGKLDKIQPMDIVMSDNSLNIVINVSGEAMVEIK